MALTPTSDDWDATDFKAELNSVQLALGRLETQLEGTNSMIDSNPTLGEQE